MRAVVKIGRFHERSSALSVHSIFVRRKLSEAAWAGPFEVYPKRTAAGSPVPAGAIGVHRNKTGMSSIYVGQIAPLPAIYCFGAGYTGIEYFCKHGSCLSLIKYFTNLSPLCW